MNIQRFFAVSLMTAAAAAAYGCHGRTVIHEQPVVVAPAAQQPVVVAQSPQPIIVQSESMPPLRAEQPGKPPRAEDVWVSGHWEKVDAGWQWAAGHWEERR